MDDRRFGWCFIGSGGITRRVMRDMGRTDGGYLAAVYSKTFENAKKLADEYGAKAYRAAAEAMDDPAVKAVYVATLHPSHKEYAMLALKKGLPVLCEKPIAMDLQDTNEIIACAKAEGAYLMDGMWTRHNPAVRKAMEWVKEGRIGRVRSLTAAFSFNRPFDASHRLFGKELGGGALLDVGIYVIAIARFLMDGQPQKISALADFAPNGVDNLCAMNFQYQDGAVARLFCGLSVDEPQDAVVYGEKGFIRLPHFWAPKFAELTVEGKTECYEPGFEGEGFQFEFDAAMADIRAGRLENELLTHGLTRDLMDTVGKVFAAIER